MAGEIFAIHGAGESETLTALTEQSYESDDLLQRFLASYPDLLAGEQIDTTQPRRWLLVDREVRVPDSEDGSGRPSLDHLFLDQDAVPTFVEVKRASDQRIRREVVGQMLDYAANALAYFPPDSLRTTFKARCEKERLDGPALLGSLICDTDPEVFWQKVKTNLQAGRVRMLFVADEIPSELRRIVGFEPSDGPGRSAAVEVRQFDWPSWWQFLSVIAP